MILKNPHSVVALYALDNYYYNSISGNRPTVKRRIESAWAVLEKDLPVEEEDRATIIKAILDWLRVPTYQRFLLKVDLLKVLVELNYEIPRNFVSEKSEQILKEECVGKLSVRIKSVEREDSSIL